MGEKRKVVVLGLDGATMDLIEPWVREGKLENFNRLFHKGAFGLLKSTIPPYSPAAWSSFITGKNPGKHGIVDFVIQKKDSLDFTPINSRVRAEKTLWRILSDYGKRVCVINVPTTFPPEEINGCMVTGMMTPSKKVQYTHPDQLSKELDEVVGNYVIHIPNSFAKANVPKYLKKLFEITEKRWKAAKYLLNKEHWDFFMIVFNGIDGIQHSYWHFLDSTHPMHERRLLQKHGNPVLQFYQYIDRILGELFSIMGEDTLLIIMSDHGSGPLKKYVYVNNWLKKWGYIKFKKGFLTYLKLFLFHVKFSPMSIYRVLIRFRMGEVKRRVHKGKKRWLMKNIFLSYSDIDIDMTKAYCLGNYGKIYINRESLGEGKGTNKYRSLIEELTKRFRQIEDPRNKKRLFGKIYIKEELYHGANMDSMPDLYLDPEDESYQPLGTHEFASSEFIEDVKSRSGDHRKNGIIFLRGPHVKKEYEITEADIQDLAPTVLAYLEVPIPSDMDGKVLSQAFTANSMVYSIEKKSPKPTEEKKQYVYSQEEEKEILAKLRGMGYL